MNLGENIYKYRTQKNMSQGDLADALDVSRQSVSKWENNNAIPDLEKLVRMSEFFEISLDALVGRAQSPSEAPAAPPVQPILITAWNRITPQKLIGIILLFTGLLFIPLSLSATNKSVMASHFLFGTLCVICGIFCQTIRYPYVYCSWAVLAAFSVFTFVLTPQWEKAYLKILIVAVSLAVMVFWTVWAQRKQRIRPPRWLLWLGMLVLAGLLILFCVNFFPPIGITDTKYPVTPATGQ